MNPITGAIADFTDLVLQQNDSTTTLYHARNAAGQRRRLLLFSAEISAEAGFRAAWRHDADLLRSLHHECLPDHVTTGEQDGRVFFSTTLPDAVPLAQFLERSSLSWDEVADVGWQTASIVQHLHNSGVSHFQLDDSKVLLTDSVRVVLVDTGTARWILAASEPHRAADFVTCCERDLVDLGRLLRQLAESMKTDASGTPQEPVPGAWQQLIADLSDPKAVAFPSSAREVQGRLGGLLLEEAGESIDVVDDRAGMVRRGRSIVHELFDSNDDIDQVVARHDSTTARRISSRSRAARLVLTAALLAGLASVAAWLLWRD